VNIAIGPKAAQYNEVHEERLVKELVEFYGQEKKANINFKIPNVSFERTKSRSQTLEFQFGLQDANRGSSKTTYLPPDQIDYEKYG